jgi:hypothetical protein
MILLCSIAAIGALALCGEAQAQTVAKQRTEVTTTERVEFGSRGTVQIIDSFGEVSVEGWDKPEVEMTVTKKTQKQYEPKNLAKGLKELERIKVEMAQVSESSLLVIKTTFPSRTPTRLMRGKTNLNLEYRIKVPRHSSLMIKHDIGEVGVANVDGDIEATNRIGEIHLRLPGENQYAVDARVKIGDVSSEFGKTDYSRQKLLGAKMESNPPPSTRRLYLRVGIGDIQVSKMSNEKADKQIEKNAVN